MSNDTTPTDQVVDSPFERRLTELIQTARTNGLDVRGSYAIRGIDDDTRWDVEVKTSLGCSSSGNGWPDTGIPLGTYIKS